MHEMCTFKCIELRYSLIKINYSSLGTILSLFHHSLIFEKLNTNTHIVLCSLQDGNGTIDASELKEILGGQLQDMDEDVWDDIIREVDTNGDGVISLEEFTEMMLKYVNDQ